MRQLYFVDNALYTGLNLTIRLGERREFYQGEEIEICSCSKDKLDLRRARIKDIYVRHIDQIVAGAFGFEHDAKVRTREGLKEALQRLYPDERINDDTVVTLIYFEVS